MTDFNPDTQRLVFKQSIIDGAPIYVYDGKTTPSFSIEPEFATEEMKMQYWAQGMTYLFDVINMTSSIA